MCWAIIIAKTSISAPIRASATVKIKSHISRVRIRFVDKLKSQTTRLFLGVLATSLKHGCGTAGEIGGCKEANINFAGGRYYKEAHFIRNAVAPNQFMLLADDDGKEIAKTHFEILDIIYLGQPDEYTIPPRGGRQNFNFYTAEDTPDALIRGVSQPDIHFDTCKLEACKTTDNKKHFGHNAAWRQCL